MDNRNARARCPAARAVKAAQANLDFGEGLKFEFPKERPTFTLSERNSGRPDEKT